MEQVAATPTTASTDGASSGRSSVAASACLSASTSPSTSSSASRFSPASISFGRSPSITLRRWVFGFKLAIAALDAPCSKSDHTCFQRCSPLIVWVDAESWRLNGRSEKLASFSSSKTQRRTESVPTSIPQNCIVKGNGSTGLGQPFLDSRSRQHRVEGSGVIHHHDVDLGGVEDNNGLHGGTFWSGDVVTGTLTVTALLVVQTGGHLLVAGGEDLEQVQLTTSTGPTGDGAVLAGSWDLGVQQPDGWHVAVESRVAVGRHLELKDKHLLSTAETVVGRDLWSVVATVVTRALVTGEDDKLAVGADSDVVQDRWGRGTSGVVGVGIRKRVSKEVGEHTGTGTTVVVQEHNVVTGAWLVVGRSDPVTRAGGAGARRARRTGARGARRGSGRGGRGSNRGSRTSGRGDSWGWSSGGGGGSRSRSAAGDSSTVLVDESGLSDVGHSSLGVLVVNVSGGGTVLDVVSLGVAGASWVVDTESGQLQWTSEVDGQLLVKRSHVARESGGAEGSVTVRVIDQGDVLVGTGETDVLVDELCCFITVVVSAGVQAVGGGVGDQGRGDGEKSGELHLRNERSWIKGMT